MNSHQKSGARPLRLRLDTFTPPTRTPWGGHRIRALKGLEPGAPVGESWELSVAEAFPARTDDGTPLRTFLDRDRGAWLGSATTPSLLVKLLDAAHPLSVQIHPSDEDDLAPGESSKPEAWYIVHAEPGAGLYLGWREGVGSADVRRAIEREQDVSRLLHFEPAAAGDYFVIEAGTPHCIGPGVFLVEPQHVAPGTGGTTYRYWDWNRRYDTRGQPDDDGTPRTLDLERALAVTRWDRAREAACLARIRHRAGPAAQGPASVLRLCAPEAETPLKTARLTGSGDVALPFAGRLRALTVLAGVARLGATALGAGRTAAIPACFEESASLEGAHAIVAATE